jgi:flagellum-specific peptidoglycan hydrolase FlgJ
MSRLAEIYKSEKKKGGGLVSALGKRTFEKLDPRQMFNQKGLAAAIAPSLFKTYSATRTGGKSPAALSTPTPQISTQNMESKIDMLSSDMRIVGNNTRVAAKNSMSLPDMARDMNVMRQNVIKLVKLQGGESTNKADMYFKKSSENEAAYETQFSKQKGVSPTPATTREPEKKTGILGFLSTLFAPLLTIGGTIAAAITATLGAIFSPDNLVKVFGLGLDIIKGLSTVFRTLLPLLTSPVFLGLVGGLLAAKWLMDLIDKKNSEANTKEKTDLRIAQDRGSQSSKLAARTIRIDEGLKSLLKDDRTDEEVSDYTRGEIRTKDELRAKIAEAEASGKRVIEIKESRVVKEQQDIQHADALKSQADGSMDAAEMRRMKIAPTPAGGAGAGRGGQGGPTAEQLSPTPVPSDTTTGPNGEFKSKQDFLTTMYPLAVKASEKLGGVDPNALLTQWGFESAWGSKTSGKYNYFGIKADKGWSGDKKDVMTHEFLNGEKVNLPQPFRSYGSPEEAVNDYVSFLKNNKRYERAGVFQAQSSSEYFGALQKAGYATDPNYASKLTNATESTGKQVAMLNLSSSGQTMASATQIPPRPSTGNALTSASVQVASAGQAGGTTVINNNTTNNNKTGGGQGSQGTPNIPSAFDDAFNMLFGRIA